MKLIHITGAPSGFFFFHGSETDWQPVDAFGNTASTNALVFFVDPDGQFNSSSFVGVVQFFMYFNGRVATRKTISNPTYCNGVSTSPNAAFDPTWFDWN